MNFLYIEHFILIFDKKKFSWHFIIDSTEKRKRLNHFKIVPNQILFFERAWIPWKCGMLLTNNTYYSYNKFWISWVTGFGDGCCTKSLKFSFFELKTFLILFRNTWSGINSKSFYTLASVDGILFSGKNKLIMEKNQTNIKTVMCYAK